MGNVRLYGATSGYTELAPPAVAPDGVLSLPSGVGTLLKAEGGKVLQVVRATDATLRQTTSGTFVDVTGMSVTITPQRTTSSIIVVATAMAGSSAAGDSRYNLRITDASNNAVSGAQAMQFGNAFSGQSGTAVNMWGYVSPATLFAVTYKLQFSSNGGTVSLVNGTTTGQMYAIEVSA